MLKVYCATSMTGRTGEELVEQSERVKYVLSHCGIKPLDPISAEGVSANTKIVGASMKELKKHWKRDKAMIREAHVVFDLTASRKSAGTEKELGYARYCLWKPVVRLWPNLGASVAWLEDDIVITEPDFIQALVNASLLATELWGTRRKRVVWRLKMLARCLPRWIVNQIREFK